MDSMMFAWGLNVLGLAIAAGLGARALFDPAWAARLVRLKADEAQAGGFAEFRATYGGVFLGAHGAGLGLSLMWLRQGLDLIGVAATGAGLVLACAWAGSCAGRCLSMWRDNTRTRFNMASAAVEAGLAAAIGAPWVVWMFSAPG